MHQLNTWEDYKTAFSSFCGEPKGRLTEILLAKIAGPESVAPCFDVLLDIDTAPDPAETIQQMTNEMKPLAGLNAEDSRATPTINLPITRVPGTRLRWSRRVLRMAAGRTLSSI
jgi:hypothetical protein